MHLRAHLGLVVYGPKWQISLVPFHTAISRKVVGKGARDNPERYCGWFWVHCSWKNDTRAQPPRKGHYREYPTGRSSLPERKASRLYYKWHSIIKDVPTQLQISGRTRTSETVGEWEFDNSLTEGKHGDVIFQTLRQCTTASTKPGFCFLLSLNVKNTVQVWRMATFDYN